MARYSRFPWLVAQFCSYLLPKHDRGTYHITINPTFSAFSADGPPCTEQIPDRVAAKEHPTNPKQAQTSLSFSNSVKRTRRTCQVRARSRREGIGARPAESRGPRCSGRLRRRWERTAVEGGSAGRAEAALEVALGADHKGRGKCACSKPVGKD